MNYNKYFAILAILSSVAIGLSFFNYFSEKQEKLAYVNTGVLVEQFDYKKDLDSKLEMFLQNQKLVMDSLTLVLNIKYDAVSHSEGEEKKQFAEEFYRFESLYNQRKQRIEEENQKLLTQYSEQMYTQLNEYVETFGEENDYTFIYGTTSNGNLMYAKKGLDLTDQISEYINKKYKGVK